MPLQPDGGVAAAGRQFQAFGAGVVAQVVLSNQQNGNYLSINIAWGFAVTMGIYVAGGVSGAHINPAVTLALAVRRDFPWSKVLPYSIAQIAGAFTGAAIAFAMGILLTSGAGVRTVAAAPGIQLNPSSVTNPGTVTIVVSGQEVDTSSGQPALTVSA